MYIAYLAVTAVAVAANGFSAGCDFARYDRVADGMVKVGVPTAWLVPLGIPKAAAAIGLLLGIAVPWIAVAAATGLIIYFCCAIAVHWRARDYTSSSLFLATGFALLAVAALLLRLATT